MRRAILLFVSLALAGCGGGDEPADADAFVTTLIRDLGSGKTAKAWESLHPLHREQVPRAHAHRAKTPKGAASRPKSTLTSLES